MHTVNRFLGKLVKGKNLGNWMLSLFRPEYVDCPFTLRFMHTIDWLFIQRRGFRIPL